MRTMGVYAGTMQFTDGTIQRVEAAPRTLLITDFMTAVFDDQMPPQRVEV